MGYQTMPESSGGTLGWRVDGRLTDDEIVAMHAQLDAAIEAAGSVRLLVDLAAMDALEPAALWEDLRRTFGKLDAIERMALLGNANWQRWLATASEALTPVEVRHYPPDQRGAAWTWLRA